MTESENNGTFRVLAACLLGAAMFAALPASATTPVRDIIRRAISPGQRVVHTVVSSAESRWQRTIDQKLAEKDQQIRELQAEIANTQFQMRRAQLAAESASQTLTAVEQNGATPFAVETAPSFIRPRAVRANVLGREILSELKSRRILDRGESDGVSSDLWVLNGDLPIVQAGSELSVASGLPVFAGRCIVGRIVDAGRWTSSLQYLTEPGFRTRAVLARNNSEDRNAAGFSFGAEGLIEGRSGLKQQGLCELSQIPTTEHVAVGQPVYSPPGHAVDAPMLFGHVVSANLPPGALHWVITVQPAVNLNHLRQVEIVVPELGTAFETLTPESDLLKRSPSDQASPSFDQTSPRPERPLSFSEQRMIPSSGVTRLDNRQSVRQRGDADS